MTDNGLSNEQIVTLVKEKFVILSYFSDDLREIRVMSSFGDDVIKVTQEFWAECLGDIRYPVDWWQAFKKHFFPKWLLHKFPVRYKIFNVEQAYPKYIPHESLGKSCTIAVPKGG